MPYLHWETDRRRLRSAEILEKYSPANFCSFDDVVERTTDQVLRTTMDPVSSDGMRESLTTGANTRIPFSNPQKMTYKTVQDPLGRLLLLAAALYEAMDGYADGKIIEEYLKSPAPLHPRRTCSKPISLSPILSSRNDWPKTIAPCSKLS